MGWRADVRFHRRPVLDTGLDFSSAAAVAIAREKLVKKWRRAWKFALIEADNPDWEDLWERWFASAPEAE